MPFFICTYKHLYIHKIISITKVKAIQQSSHNINKRKNCISSPFLRNIFDPLSTASIFVSQYPPWCQQSTQPWSQSSPNSSNSLHDLQLHARPQSLAQVSTSRTICSRQGHAPGVVQYPGCARSKSDHHGRLGESYSLQVVHALNCSCPFRSC